MQKAILALQILFLSVGIYFVYKLNQLSIEIEKALLVIQEIQTYTYKIENIIEKFEKLEPIFDNLTRLSEIISIIIDPLGSEG